MHYILIFIISVYFLLLLALWQGCKKNNQRSVFQRNPLVSVIIAAKNEQQSLPFCLNALKQQTWPQSHLQVIVIDDNSNDATLEIIRDFENKFKHFVAIVNPDGEFKSSKKNALKLAATQACGEFLFFTDADCTPPQQWIESMLAHFSTQTGLVAGFSPQQFPEKKIWNAILCIDALSAAFVAAGTIGWNNGVTCAGRNLAVRKTAFQNIGGYDALPDTLSGDDDFLLQKMAVSKWEIGYALQKETIVPADGPENVPNFLHQKTRHISAGADFSLFAQTGYALYHLLNFTIWGLALFSLFSAGVYALPFLFKLMFDLYFLYSFGKKLGIPVHFEFLVWEALFLFYNIRSVFTAFGGKVNW